MPEVFGVFFEAISSYRRALWAWEIIYVIFHIEERNLREGSLIWLTVERIQPIEARNSW